jgi:hypothetical protein
MQWRQTGSESKQTLVHKLKEYLDKELTLIF